MATASAKSKNTDYTKARESFDHLEIEQRARFLFEATVATIADGIERMSSVLTSEFDSVFKDCDVDGKPKTAKKKKPSASARKTKAQPEDES